MKRQPIRCPEDLYQFTPGHPVETIANLDRIPIRDNGEHVVDLRVSCPDLIIRPLSGHKQSLHAREGVVRRLNQAQAFLEVLAPGHRIIVVDAWRPLARQARWHNLANFVFRIRHPLWSSAMIREAANKYVAAPDALTPPPHSTGGAIDLRLGNKAGRALRMGPRIPAACHTAYPKLSPIQLHRRRVLCSVLEEAGFSNYEEEWWHWSYGDSGWALRTNQPHALYGMWEK
ncbi:MAG: zinc D-Ala-D-Ala dipeptidase [Abditibacteriota bacterium]|nr:zinc D-Ala-D-Ala dipeptidase [Abditibacteriota bacterium]